MNIDDDYEDSGNETSGDDVDFAIDGESSANRELQSYDDDYQYEVLSTEDIVQHMVDCIKEVCIDKNFKIIYSIISIGTIC